MSKYLANNQIAQMADAALSNYEFSCDWRVALEAAIDYSVEEFGIKPRQSAALLAVKQARLQWKGISMGVKRKIEEERS